ncbi:hypothetical protein DFA_11771 [Cavenderia fasciculata]|uniref:Uncharacterized protein n=1 Tax=Cavenderia fasciculata TaxID=261658 RepID=F4QE62_CACFS|nr:uncharacterized protein DFA_11771 [Cavenderia fasciculata]EGG14009.1 hypothetical protein DFA_11771 [Cavenderia fasciculata]|eukprot:XP_004350717.1 hypothetical protein DFA_11771 [Cavenderia fasciculata]
MKVDLDSIALLPRLEHLSVRGLAGAKLGQHRSLKSLRLDVNDYGSYRQRDCLADFGLDKFVSLTDLSLKNHCLESIGPDLPTSLTNDTPTKYIPFIDVARQTQDSPV